MPFTGRPLKALKNSSGIRSEILASQSFHAEGVPLLVSPALLRERFLGQVDLVRMLRKKNGEWLLEIGEVKTSVVGWEGMVRGQRKRLFDAGNFLSGLFGVPARMIQLIPEK